MKPEQYERVEQLETSLTNHTPDAHTVELIETIRLRARLLGQEIIQFGGVNRETNLALTKLEESVMWAVKALVLPCESE